MAIDDNDPRPPYLQLAAALRRAIETGEYRPGARLPSIRDLAKEYGIAAQTVQNALRELRSEGLVVSQQGRAFFVRDPDRVPETELTLSTRVSELEATVKALTDRVAALEAKGKG
ncbi:GntR family transcriptional regulator [Bailinhaonella thermotolerans]|uniref:GntR family transcriptional regulator n=1 Tax=Bailinhaonella thermotolerans TaxID=1070861 RepID=A0A3A4A077_9ACTN|nr:winged helix-turn-helix domain-containing protein [Bailinhaonella thermotolerans]RJL19569.1 GntR family transcriptional regulator [Bailinhaonella thermotolerans]